MSTEKIVAQEIADTSRKVVAEGVRLVRKAWSIMDAAAEKTQPTEYLSEQAIKSIQGKQ